MWETHLKRQAVIRKGETELVSISWVSQLWSEGGCGAMSMEMLPAVSWAPGSSSFACFYNREGHSGLGVTCLWHCQVPDSSKGDRKTAKGITSSWGSFPHPRADSVPTQSHLRLQISKGIVNHTPNYQAHWKVMPLHMNSLATTPDIALLWRALPFLALGAPASTGRLSQGQHLRLAECLLEPGKPTHSAYSWKGEQLWVIATSAMASLL